MFNKVSYLFVYTYLVIYMLEVFLRHNQRHGKKQAKRQVENSVLPVAHFNREKAIGDEPSASRGRKSLPIASIAGSKGSSGVLQQRDAPSNHEGAHNAVV